MFCYNGSITNTSGDALAGYFVECLSGTTVQAIYANNDSAPISTLSGVTNRAKADARGNVFFYVPDGEYTLRYYDKNGVLAWSDPNPHTMVGLDSVLAVTSRVRFVSTFADLAALSVTVGEYVQTSGYATVGDGGGGTYLAKSSTAAHPRCISATDTPGVYMWLQQNAQGLVAASMVGAIGTPTENHATNHQPALQAAIDYAYAIDAKGVWLGNGVNYSVWTPLRTNAAFTEVNIDQTGFPLKFQADKDSGLFAGSQGANLWRRSNSGGDPAVIGAWQTIPAGIYPPVWRGGMCFIRGLSSAPTTRANFTLENIKMRGGLAMDAWGGGGAFNANGVGDGQDRTDKPVYFENDRYVPNMRFLGDCLITGFAGENVYAQGTPYQLEMTQRGRLEISEGNFSAINPNGQRLVQFDNLYVNKCYYVFEGAIGGSDSYINVYAKDCTRVGGIGGGSLSAVPPFSQPTRYADDVLPFARLNATFQNCGQTFFPGWWLDMKVKAIDTNVLVTDSAAATVRAGEMLLDLDMVLDKKNGMTLSFLAPTITGGDKKFNHFRGRVRYMRTKAATDAGFKFQYMFSQTGSFGDDCILDWMGCGSDFTQGMYEASVADFGFKVTGDIRAQAASAGGWHSTGQWNAQTTATVGSRLPVIRLTSTGAGNWPVNLPTTNLVKGQRMRLYNFQGADRFFVVGASSTRNVPVLIPNNLFAEFEFDGAGWSTVEAPGPITTTVAALPTANATSKGLTAFVTDATAPAWGATVAGGGAVFTPVVCNGTAWVVG